MSNNKFDQETLDFLKGLSVELKNSLTALSGLNYLSEQNIRDPEKLEDILKKSREGIEHLLSISENLSDAIDGKTVSTGNTSHTVSAKKKKDKKDVNILIADDNELLAEVLLEIIQEDGYRGQIANDGEEAVKLFSESEENEFDLIFMDVQMPNKNGLEATKEIRALKRKDSKKIPILAFTASDSESDKKAAFEAGMNDFITKPVNGDILLEKIRNAI